MAELIGQKTCIAGRLEDDGNLCNRQFKGSFDTNSLFFLKLLGLYHFCILIANIAFFVE